MPKLYPRESGEFIAKNSKNIKILDEGIRVLAMEVVERLLSGSLSPHKVSQNEVHPKATEEYVDWIFVVDTLNFCFWTLSDSQKKWTVTFKGKEYTGYFALCAAVQRAMEEGYDIINPKYYSQISLKDLKHILRGDDENVVVNLIQERLDCLHEVGQVLLENFSGSFKECIKAAGNSASLLLDIIVENFSCFRDECDYRGNVVCFYKRAQILIGDLWVCFKGQDWGRFDDIGQLTMFADYRVPQVLYHFKVFTYSNQLMAKMTDIMVNGSEEEAELRGCSIHAVELLNKEIKRVLPDIVPNFNEKNDIVCNSVVLDHFLWDYRRQHASELEYIPFHKVLCVYY